MYHAIKRKHTDKYKENIFMGLYNIVQNIFEQVAPPYLWSDRWFSPCS
jgi:hypothetical protein